ncbi:GIY-YIG nuclease family protein [Cyclobacterium roseum]|uniref:GIY-YIG nuclease family protein n=1 Tax=Cyclobacterium roseum TaxID=2666137 RepID=UPI001F46CB41|nr:GIY-YIG nuclease family protein [Cyclobacterium roseum]
MGGTSKGLICPWMYTIQDSYIVYILFFPTLNRYYVGQTKDPDDRILRHNSGRNKSTKGGIPWKTVHSEPGKNRADAIVMEKQIKNQGFEKVIANTQMSRVK